MPIDPQTEKRAFAAQENGEPKQAVSELMQSYGDDVYRHCLSFTSDTQTAEDLLQKVFIQVFQGLTKDIGYFSGQSSWRTWLMKIATNRCLDHLKGEKRRARVIEFTDQQPEVVDSSATPPEDANEQAALRGCLQRLSDAVRLAVIARYYSGLSYRECAEVFGVSAGTLQARVVRALPKLRACLGEQGVRL